MRGLTAPKGRLQIKHKRNKASLGWRLRNTLRWGFLKGWFAYHVVAPIANKLGVMTAMGRLSFIHYHNGVGTRYDNVGYRVVTTAWAEFVVDQLQTETSEFGDFKFHDSGVGSTAENVTDTDIETTDGESRATGTQTESSSVIYESVGTITYTSTKAIVEHGLFSQSTGTTLMDRTVFSAVNVVNTDSISFTYDITIVAGS